MTELTISNLQQFQFQNFKPSHGVLGFWGSWIVGEDIWLVNQVRESSGPAQQVLGEEREVTYPQLSKHRIQIRGGAAGDWDPVINTDSYFCGKVGG